MMRPELKKLKVLLVLAASTYLLAWATFLVLTTTTDESDEKETVQNNVLSDPPQSTSNVIQQDPATSIEQEQEETMVFTTGELLPVIEPIATTNNETKVIDNKASPIPPMDPPKDISIDGKIITSSCWDATGFPHDQESCGKLSILSDVLEKRLYVVDRCRKQIVGKYATGNLDLGMELDFETGTLSFWNKPSSSIPNGSEIAECLTKDLQGLPFGDLAPKYARYHFSLILKLGSSDSAVATIDPTSVLKEDAVAPSKIEEGRIVAVVRDRVRVRKSPIDGEILGKISSPNRVLLIEESDGWCRVKTSRGKVGWMVCWALSL